MHVFCMFFTCFCIFSIFFAYVLHIGQALRIFRIAQTIFVAYNA